MALTISNVEFYGIGNRRMHRFDVAFDASYPTGGETFVPGTVHMRDIDMMLISPKNGYIFEYDYSEDKILVFNTRGAVENTLVASVDPGATTVVSNAANGEIISLTGDAGVTGGAGSEVDNATNLVLLTGVRCLAIGF